MRFEDFGESHVQVMSRVRASVVELTTGSQALLAMCTDLACGGSLPTTEQREQVRQGVDELRDAIKALAAEFAAARKAAKLPKLSEQLLSEHAFCFAVSNYAHIAIHFAEFIIDPNFDETNNEGWMPHQSILAAVVGVFDSEVLHDRMHLNWTLKNSLAVIICFAIGFVGLEKTVLGYSAGIASTCSVLLSKFSGSAMKKNLMRLQGVVIGLSAGELGFALLGHCDHASRVAMLIFLGLWLSTTLFFYYDSAVYGPITCLMAAFGTQFFLKPCSDEAVDPTRNFYPIIDVVICILVMSLMDQLLSLGRPSVMAHEAISSAWRSLWTATSDVMDPIKEEVRLQCGSLRRAIAEAKYLGSEAEDEPRLWRTEWKAQTFTDAVHCASEVRVNLSNLEFSVGDHNHGVEKGHGAPKADLFLRVMTTKEWIDLRREILHAMDRISKVLPIFVHEELSKYPFLHSPEFLHHVNIQSAVDRLIEALNEASEFEFREDPADLTCDTAARLSTVFLSLVGMNHSMRTFRHACIRGG